MRDHPSPNATTSPSFLIEYPKKRWPKADPPHPLEVEVQSPVGHGVLDEEAETDASAQAWRAAAVVISYTFPLQCCKLLELAVSWPGSAIPELPPKPTSETGEKSRLTRHMQHGRNH